MTAPQLPLQKAGHPTPLSLLSQSAALRVLGALAASALLWASVAWALSAN